jgi:uncharacterized membrane protein
MKAKVAIYDSHEKAVNAVKELESANFPIKQVSIIGKAEIIDDHMHVKSMESAENAPLAIGSIAGPVLGILTGLGIFAIPGFGFLYGAGAIIGAMAGLEVGALGGGLISLLVILGIDKQEVLKYEKNIIQGNFLVVVQGSIDEIKTAEHILHTEETHPEFGT